jgi:Bacterial toxin 44/Domain of unknown function (DUF4150)
MERITMAKNEGVPKTDMAIVQNVLPDLCWTPFGPWKLLVPYSIFAKFDLSVDTDATVRLTGFDAFTMFSRITKVVGNEAGKLGGLWSTVNKGWCRPISHNKRVRAGKQFIIYHSSLFWMNCADKDGTPNTIGRVVYVRVQSFVWIDESFNFTGAPFVDGADMDYGRFDTALQFIYDEMMINSKSDLVKDINALNNPGMWERIFGGLLGPEGTAKLLWYDKVRPGGDWDHKHTLDRFLHLGADGGGKGDYYFPLRGDTVHEYYYDIWSNIHYGYVGSAAGFSPETLQHYAGLGANNWIAELFVGKNDEADVLTTQIGIDLYKEHGSNLTKEQLAEAIQKNLPNLMDAARKQRRQGNTGVVITPRNRK